MTPDDNNPPPSAPTPAPPASPASPPPTAPTVAAPLPPPAPAVAPPPPPAPARPPRRWLRPLAGIGIVAIAAATAILFSARWDAWVGSRIDQATDDAYVKGDITPL